MSRLGKHEYQYEKEGVTVLKKYKTKHKISFQFSNNIKLKTAHDTE